MRLGINIPNIGKTAGPEAIMRVAQEAEKLGFDSVWTTDRVMWPLEPKTGYAGIEGLALPEPYKVALDPLDALTYAGAVTKTVRLGTSVLDLPYYNPLLLARRVTTLDVLSGGRVTLGLGIGWSADETVATGGKMSNRGRRADEAIAVMRTIWKNDPVEFDGQYYKIPKSVILPKPVQKPNPPIFMAAFAPASMKRVATLADGWLPVLIPVEGMKMMWEQIKTMAAEAGRNPEAMEMIVRAHIEVHPEAMGEGRAIFVGSADEVKSDIQAVKAIGAHEIHFDPTFGDWGQSTDGFVECMQRVKEWAN